MPNINNIKSLGELAPLNAWNFLDKAMEFLFLIEIDEMQAYEDYDPNYNDQKI